MVLGHLSGHISIANIGMGGGGGSGIHYSSKI